MFVQAKLCAAIVAVGFVAIGSSARAQVEPISHSSLPAPGAFIETFEFAHDTSMGGSRTEFSFIGAVAPAYDPMVSHTLVVNFSWRLPDDTLVISPDHIFTIPGAVTYPFSTGIFDLADCPDTVGIQFAGGGPMTIVGSFTHVCVPEPSGLALAGAALAALGLVASRRSRQAA